MHIDEYRLSKLILSARKRLKLTQSEVSSLTGITQGTLSKIESFQCSVSAKHWFLLSHILKIPSESVWTGLIDRGERPFSTSQENPFKLPKKYYCDAYSSIKEIIPVVKYICEKFGEDEFEQFLKTAKVSGLIFFDLNNKINFLFVCDLLKHFYGEELTDDLFLEISKYSREVMLHGIHSDQYKKKNSSISLLKSFLENAPFYQDTYKYKIVEKSNDSISFELESNEEALSNLLEIEKTYIPFIKAYMQNFSMINENQCLKITLSEVTGYKAIKFLARTSTT